jgi:hypothetical protein
MSYPSIDKHLKKQGVDINTANDNQLHTAFINAFKEDLKLGWAKVKELVQKLNGKDEERVMLTLDPNSEEGKQFARLLGPDIPRKVLEDFFGVKFGFYNCCRGVVASDKESLQLSLKEQVEAQHPNFVDC